MNKSSSFILIYIFIVTFVIAALFEFVILPWYFKLPRDMALIGFAAEPNITIDDTSINTMGFTGDVIGSKKNPKKIRILTLGGSAMFNRRMTERLKESLSEVSDRPIEILGAALRTHTSMSSVIKYRELSKYNFDIVLIYHGINDLFVNHVDKDFFKSDYSHMLSWYRRSYILDNSLIARVVYNNLIWGRKMFGGKKIWYIYPKETENAMNYISENLFRNNINTLVNKIKQNGSVPVLMSFAWNIPEHYSNELFLSGEVGYAATEFGRYPVELWGSEKFVREGIRSHNSAILQIAREHDVMLIDQENFMGKNLRWYEDACHLSEEGTYRFILNIRKFLVNHNLIKKQSLN